MRLELPSMRAIALGVCAGALLGGCGSTTKTVSVAGPPSASRSGGASTAPTTTGSSTTAPGSSTTAPGASAPSGGTRAQPGTGGTTAPAQGATSTRTAPEPAFAQGNGGEGLSAATAVVQARGFTPTDSSDYHPGQTLQVLIGSRSGSGGGSDQQAFFFVNGRYIGTDTSEPSGHVSVVEQGDTEVSLAYALYRPGDHACCASGGQATVRFELNNGALAPLDPIPPVASSTGLSRQ